MAIVVCIIVLAVNMQHRTLTHSLAHSLTHVYSVYARVSVYIIMQIHNKTYVNP